MHAESQLFLFNYTVGLRILKMHTNFRNEELFLIEIRYDKYEQLQIN